MKVYLSDFTEEVYESVQNITTPHLLRIRSIDHQAF